MSREHLLSPLKLQSQFTTPSEGNREKSKIWVFALFPLRRVQSRLGHQRLVALHARLSDDRLLGQAPSSFAGQVEKVRLTAKDVGLGASPEPLMVKSARSLRRFCYAARLQNCSSIVTIRETLSCRVLLCLKEKER
jgi:hypothetical protein